MKKIILTAAVVCLLLVGCATAPGTSAPGTSNPGASAPTTVPGTQAPTTPTTIPTTTLPPFTYPTLPTIPTTEPTVPETTVPAGPVHFIFYLPNESADGFMEREATIEQLIPEGILLILQVNDVVNDNVTIRSAVMQGSQLNLDLNQAFLDQLLTTGASGEKMLVGSIVNTFLSAYGAETVMLTVNGEIIDSGHTVFDAPLSKFN